MIIVSQDKTRFVNFERIEILGVDINNKLQIACGFSEGSMVLGAYKTEERAKEVLQEIVRYYATANIGQVYEMPEE